MFSTQKWQTSFNFNLQHYGWELTCTTNCCTPGFFWHWPSYSFQNGWDRIFSPKQRHYWKSICSVCWKLGKFGCLWSFSTLSFLQWNCLWVRRAYHKPCWHSLMWSVLLISVGQLLMLDDVLFAGSKQEWGESPAEVNCEAQSTAVSLCLGASRSLWNAPLFRAY